VSSGCIISVVSLLLPWLRRLSTVAHLHRDRSSRLAVLEFTTQSTMFVNSNDASSTESTLGAKQVQGRGTEELVNGSTKGWLVERAEQPSPTQDRGLRF
jgi:hypothetical protein